MMMSAFSHANGPALGPLGVGQGGGMATASFNVSLTPVPEPSSRIGNYSDAGISHRFSHSQKCTVPVGNLRRGLFSAPLLHQFRFSTPLSIHPNAASRAPCHFPNVIPPAGPVGMTAARQTPAAAHELSARFVAGATVHHGDYFFAASPRPLWFVLLPGAAQFQAISQRPKMRSAMREFNRIVSPAAVRPSAANRRTGFGLSNR